jgi:hypothetical protein
MDLVLPAITEGYVYSNIYHEMNGGTSSLDHNNMNDEKIVVGGMPIVDILKLSVNPLIGGGGEGFAALANYAVPIGLVNMNYQYPHKLHMPSSCSQEHSVIEDAAYDKLIDLVSARKKSDTRTNKSESKRKTLKKIQIKE